MFRITKRLPTPWLLVIALIFVTSTANMGCQSPAAVLPQVGKAAVPEIFLPDRPTLRPFTAEEFDKIPDGAHGKVLSYLADVQSYEDQADIAVDGYRSYIRGLFDKEGAAKEEKTPAKSWYQFWK